MSPGAPQFARRILLVSGDGRYLVQTSMQLREQQYEVLTAQDGFAALMVLRGAVPDLLISELSLPGMSGFELLSVVRNRFPQIAVIATSSEYSAVTLPAGTIADAFILKRPGSKFELLMAVRDLIASSPLRAAQAKSDSAPVWVPRSATGYVIVTCPDCLRSFSVAQPDAKNRGTQIETCLACNGKVRFQMVAAGAAHASRGSLPTERARSMMEKTKAVVSDAHRTLSRAQALLEKHRAKR